MASSDEERLAGVAAGAAAAAAGVYVADQIVRARARARLGADFAPEGTAHVSRDGMQRLAQAGSSVQGADREALKKFGAGGSWLINRFTRSGEIVEVKQGRVVPVPKAEAVKRLPAYADIINRVQRVASSSTLPENMRLFRGMGTRSVGPGVFQPGFQWTDRGFQFASTSLDAAHPYYEQAKAKGSRPAMLVIDAGGAKGVSTAATSEFAHTKPVVLPKDTTLRVDRVETGVRRHLFDRRRDYVFASVVGDKARPASPQPVNRPPVSGNVLAKVSASASVMATLASAGLAYSQAKANGQSEMRAVGEGATAAAATAIFPLAAAGAAHAAVKSGMASKAALAIAGKAALPLSIVGTAAYYGWRAMQEGRGAAGTAKAVAWGAVNGLIPVDLARQAYDGIASSRNSTAHARPANLTPEQQQSFASLDQQFTEARRAPAPEEANDGKGKKGWANPATQRAAQEKRGVANFTDWAKA